jgi:two-component system, NtrC family, sensor histidine kinase HydH
MWAIPEREATRLDYAELMGRCALPGPEAEHLCSLMTQVLRTGEAHLGYKTELHPRGEPVYLNLLMSPLVDRQGQCHGVVQICEDVTRSIRMEAEMARIRRLADIGQLAAKMAHEVRNPLSSIKGAAQLMRNEYEDVTPLREFLDIIVDEVNSLSRTTSDLLDFARPMRLDVRTSNVNELTERTLRLLSGDLRGHGIVTEFQPQPDLPAILADPKQLEQVMRNLILNAAQAMPNGGTLCVTTQDSGDSRTVILRFSDTGVGIAPEQLEAIFQPFYTTKTKGSGLGLCIVQKIVENHGGTVDVSSSPGEGSCFTVTLPTRPSVPDVTRPSGVVESPSFASLFPDD